MIATGEPAEAIGEALRAHDFDATVFDHTRSFLEDRTCSASTVVLWVEDAMLALTESIEPLAKTPQDTPAIVVVCTAIQRWELRATLAAGVAGVVRYDEIEFALSPCIRAASSGQVCVPRAQWEQIDPPALSTREKQILGLVVLGYMNSQIASQLYLAESTVKSHLSSAFAKLGVRSRNEAVELIINPERGLGMGILELGGEPLQAVSAGAS